MRIDLMRIESMTNQVCTVRERNSLKKGSSSMQCCLISFDHWQHTMLRRRSAGDKAGNQSPRINGARQLDGRVDRKIQEVSAGSIR